MSDKEIKKMNRVEELINFPFKTFQEFKKANMDDVAYPSVDRGVALDWAHDGIYAPGFLRNQTDFLALLPFIAVLGFIVWVIVSKSWLMLLALPVLLIAIIIFRPSWETLFGKFLSGFIGLSFVGLVYSFMTNRMGLFALCLTLIIIWYAQKTMYKKAVNYLIKAVSKHEDLLCILWQKKALNIMFFNGNRYWADWKTENGHDVDYKDK